MAAALVMYGVIRELGVGITGQKLVRAHTINSIAIVWLLISATGPVRDAYANRPTPQKPMEDVFAYTDTRTFPDYLEVAEELNMKILDILARVGTTLALPGQTLYMEPLPEMT